jgi:probable phosphoglycerate mutase
VTLARLLGERGLDPATLHFVTSPLSRARDTMDLLRAELGGDLPAVTLDERL